MIHDPEKELPLRSTLSLRVFSAVFLATILSHGVAAQSPAAPSMQSTSAPAAGASPTTANDGAKPDDDDADDSDQAKTPEQKMQSRFPQPIRVGDLVGQPILDGDHATIGYVERVVRSSGGKIKLIVRYRPWFAWARFLGDYAARPVAVPLEAVGSMGQALSSIDMDRPSYDAAPSWKVGADADIPPNDVIQIAIARE